MTKQSRREFLTAAGTAAAAAAAISLLKDEPALAQEPAKASRPNLLFLFPDQHRFDWLGTTPNLPVRTPNLDALAARGVRFTNAFTPSPVCAPARACVAAGKDYGRCGVADNSVNYPDGQMTFYRLLREGGYHVMGCGKFDLRKPARDWGIDGKRRLPEWGFSDGVDSGGKNDAVGSGRDVPRDPYMYFLETRGLRNAHIEDFAKRGKAGVAATFATSLPDDAYGDNWVAGNGLELVRRAPADKPWFLQVNFPGPHPPWDITESMARLYEGVDFPQPNDPGDLTREQYNAIRRNYSAMVTNIDRLVGVFLDELNKRGELENTLIVYSSDHGEMLGDHGLFGKSVPFQPSVGVPLIVAGPGASPGAVSGALVDIMDLAATFLDYGGVRRPDDMDSLSLRPVIEGKTQLHRDSIDSALRGWRMVFDGRYKTISGYGPRGVENPPPMLFDLKKDPGENANLAAGPTK